MYDLLSDFAGIDVRGMALNNLDVLGTHHLFEIDSAARHVLEVNCPLAHLHGSVTERATRSNMVADIVTAGFPCQPFSALGRQEGWHDSLGRGTVVQSTIDYIIGNTPRIVLLENVAAFTTVHNGCVIRWIIKS